MQCNWAFPRLRHSTFTMTVTHLSPSPIHSIPPSLPHWPPTSSLAVSFGWECQRNVFYVTEPTELELTKHTMKKKHYQSNRQCHSCGPTAVLAVWVGLRQVCVCMRSKYSFPWCVLWCANVKRVSTWIRAVMLFARVLDVCPCLCRFVCVLRR